MPLAIFIAALGLAEISAIYRPLLAPPLPQNNGVACTQEAKLCPGGSYVGRTGPNCEFSACPSEASSTANSDGGSASCANGVCANVGILQGKVEIGPICPVERIDNPCKPTPEMYAARKVLIYDPSGNELVKTVSLNDNGGYETYLAPGNYIVDISGRTQGIGGVSGVPQTISVRANATITVNINIDTGIR